MLAMLTIFTRGVTSASYLPCFFQGEQVANSQLTPSSADDYLHENASVIPDVCPEPRPPRLMYVKFTTYTTFIIRGLLCPPLCFDVRAVRGRRSCRLQYAERCAGRAVLDRSVKHSFTDVLIGVSVNPLPVLAVQPQEISGILSGSTRERQ